MRFLIQIDPAREEQITTALCAIRIPPMIKIFDYLPVDIPEEIVDKVRAMPGVIDVVPDKEARIVLALPYTPTPIDKKLSEFRRLFLSNPLTGPAAAFANVLKLDAGKTRVPTSVSRKMVGADIADGDSISGKGIKVAVLDTGTAYDFFFQGPYRAGSKSAIEGQPLPYDEVGHSEHVCTTISGRPYNSSHGLLRGVAGDAQVAAFKCLGGGLGVGMTSWILRSIADALEWARGDPLIINMSLGGPDEDYTVSVYHRIISGLMGQSVIFCVAAGNSGPDSNTIGSPGSMPDALTVGAVDIEGNVASFSSRGPTLNKLVKPDVVAPGVDILSTSSGYIAAMQALSDGPPALACISGTSMATPHVSGVVALASQYALATKGKRLTTDNIKEAMSLYGDYAGAKNSDYGWGLINYQILRRYVDERL